MKKLTVLNDWHIGANRTGGTTQATAYELRQHLLQQFEDTLYDIDTDLMILGDLFDGPDISRADWLKTYCCLDDWLARTGNNLWLANGNHDLSKNSSNLSSFQLLAAMLSVEGKYAGKVTHVEAGTKTRYGYVIPHVANQDLFNLEISKVPPCGCLFLHCNYNNKFAVESDHSLNLGEEQAKALPVKHIIFAHEHQQRVELGGKVVVIGNQVPSSVSDCLGNSFKRCLELGEADSTDVLADAYEAGREPEPGPHISLAYCITWTARGDFSEQDWRSLKDEGRFVRVIGEAAAEEAAAVIAAIARFRQTAKVLVITNAVKVAGLDNSQEFAISHEEIKAFDVRSELLAELSADEATKINKLEEGNV